MTIYRVHHVGEHTTERCRCGFELTYRIESPAVRNARRAHQCFGSAAAYTRAKEGK